MWWRNMYSSSEFQRSCLLLQWRFRSCGGRWQRSIVDGRFFRHADWLGGSTDRGNEPGDDQWLFSSGTAGDPDRVAPECISLQRNKLADKPYYGTTDRCTGHQCTVRVWRSLYDDYRQYDFRVRCAFRGKTTGQQFTVFTAHQPHTNQ